MDGDSAQKLDSMHARITSLMEGHASHDLQRKNLSVGQSELVTSAQALQASHNELGSHFQKVEPGLAGVAAKQAKVYSDYRGPRHPSPLRRASTLRCRPQTTRAPTRNARRL